MEGDMLEPLGKLLIYIVYGLISLVVGVITIIMNKKRVRERMELLDYNEGKEKRKNDYTRNTFLDEQIALKIKEDDENFDEQAFKEWTKETFIEFQKAWSDKNISKIRSRLDDNLYEHYELLLKSNIDKDCINKIEIKKINYIDFSAYSKDNEKEIIEVAINSVLVDYTLRGSQREIVEGSDTVKIRSTYKLNFYRKNGAQSAEVENSESCPNCGGKIVQGQNKCEYCEALLQNNVNKWLLNSIEKY